MEIKEIGDCGNPKDNHADASVTAFNTKGELCISIANLTRIPPDALIREVLALLFHEMVHLSGGDETLARAWQSRFREYFSHRFGDLRAKEIFDKTWFIFMNAESLLNFAIHKQNEKPNDPKVYLLVGRYIENLAAIPYREDLLRLDLSYNPAKPWLGPNLSMSIEMALENACIPFGSGCPPVLSTLEMFVNELSPPVGLALTNRLQTMKSELTKLAGNFLAYTGKTGFILLSSIPPEQIQPGCIQADAFPNSKVPCDPDIAPKDDKNRHTQ